MGVYFISDGELIKIGYTGSSPHKRLAALQTGNPKPLGLLAFKPEWGMDKEKELHRKFAPLRAFGEWFYASKDLIEYIGVALTSIDSGISKLQDFEIVGKKPGYAEERIRRTILAIQAYNAGRQLSEQVEINVGSLRTLSAASASKVGQYCKKHSDALAKYAASQGHPGKTSKLNRGKDLLKLIPLAWNQEG